MGKKAASSDTSVSPQLSPETMSISPRQSTDFSISEQNYVQFFEFLKELHLTERHENMQKAHLESSLTIITSTLMDFFNYAKVFSVRQLECSTICLANLFNVIGSNLCSLTFERQFIIKLRRFTSNLVQEGKQPGYEQKVQAILYILVVLIYKERMGEVRPIRELNKKLFNDRLLIESLLQLSLPSEKKIGKFYGIVIVYLSNRKNNNKLRKLIIKSILLNFGSIDHETTLLNLLVYLRNEKNKVTINLKDLQEGNMAELLIKAYPRHIHEYQSFYILDYLHHLLMLFPSLALQVISSRFIPFLLQTAGPTNFHHPLHEATIITFIESTLKYLEPTAKQQLIQQITNIQPFNQYITIRLVQMLIDFQTKPSQLLVFAHRGYFDRLLSTLTKQEEEGIKRRAVELHLKVILRIQTINSATATFLLFKLQSKVQALNNSHLQALITSAHPQQNSLLI